ncbi:L-threonine 3-dehydrogenase, partial [Salmonella enterica subsp. enterica serovar Infantis]
TRAVNVAKESLNDVREERGMTEGFDGGLEMSGAPPAFRPMLDTMNHGGRIAMLGIPPSDLAIDWTTGICRGVVSEGLFG